MTTTDADDRVSIMSAAQMPLQTLRMHIQKRHGRLGFWSRGEHDADHRLRPDAEFDHTHRETA